jgi:hypothetical protein
VREGLVLLNGARVNPENCPRVFEKWDKIYVDEVFQIVGRAWDYVEMESSNTLYDLSKRIITNSKPTDDDIIVEFDVDKISQNSVNILRNIHYIIKDSGEVGTFELDIFKITINRMVEHQNDLANLNNPYYQQKLV